MVGGTSFAPTEARSSAPAGPALSPAWSTDPGVAGSLVVGGSVDGGSVVVGTELGALVVGTYEGGKLRYGGRVGSGFDTKTRRELRQQLDPSGALSITSE